MQRFWEIIFGLDRGFLGREGEFALSFNPQWPGQAVVGAGVWNLVLVALAVALVVYVYRREGHSRRAKVSLGVVRLVLLALLIALLNRPVLTLTQTRTEPSVLAVMIDDSISMGVRDISDDPSPEAPTRLAAAVELLSSGDRALLERLREEHELRLYRFDSMPAPIIGSDAKSLEQLEPTGQNTRVARSIRRVMDELQGQRLAGVVVLTDGRDTPADSTAEVLGAIKEYGVKVFPIPVGSDRPPTNIVVQSVNVQESAFKGDIVNVRVTVQGTGFDVNHPVMLQLKDKETGGVLTGLDGNPAERSVELPSDEPLEAELQFMAEEEGQLDLLVEAVRQPGEIDEVDNIRPVQISVLDAKVRVLYVDGYPRWEYRYLKTEMMRDRTVEISLLLTSADPTFRQEGDIPITRFPENLDELMEYDVVLFGDVDPRQFSDAQLQLVSDFVSKNGGGFGMVSGPRWSPHAFRHTAIEPILPVTLAPQPPIEDRATIAQGFRPVLTKAGADSSMFRFFADREENDRFIREGLQPIFWYARGVTAKPGVGEVYAEHPSETDPQGRKAPLLVMGRFGAGRTLFSAIDDSWRWRYYTGETIFDTYWIQQIRHLARSKKLGQRRATFTVLRTSYELGEQVRMNLRVLDPQLLQQLPETLSVNIYEGSSGPADDEANPAAAPAPGGQGTLVRQERLVRQSGQPDLYTASFTADRVGNFTAVVPPIAGGIDAMSGALTVSVPRLELAQPQVDRANLSRLASETMGQVVPFDQARDQLPALVPSAAKIIPIEAGQPLWDAPLALILFVLLITLEWVMRKLYGML